MDAQTKTAIEELSDMLGLVVLDVQRDAPAHRRSEVTDADGAWRRRPATELDGSVAREWWNLKIAGDYSPLGIRVTSDQIRDSRRLNDLTRRLGRTGPRLDNHTARRVLAVMHRILEDRA